MKREKHFVVYLSIIAFIYFLIVSISLQFPKYNIPHFQNGTYIFYDNFDAPVMHFDWLWGYDFGEGFVILSQSRNCTFIEFHIYGKNYTRANFLREFPSSPYAEIEVVLQFIGLSNDSIGLIMFRTDGGWFGITRPEPTSIPQFVYVDDLGRKPPNFVIKPVDSEWHHVVIKYENGVRKIYFDGKLVEVLQGPPEFDQLIIGTRDYVKNYAGVFRINYVKVKLQVDQNSRKKMMLHVLYWMITVISLLLLLALMFQENISPRFHQRKHSHSLLTTFNNHALDVTAGSHPPRLLRRENL